MATTFAGVDGLVTTNEAAEVLGMTPSAVVQRIRRHRIYTVWVGRATG